MGAMKARGRSAGRSLADEGRGARVECARDRRRRLAGVSERHVDDQLKRQVELASLALDDPLADKAADDAVVIVGGLRIDERTVDGYLIVVIVVGATVVMVVRASMIAARMRASAMSMLMTGMTLRTVIVQQAAKATGRRIGQH